MIEYFYFLLYICAMLKISNLIPLLVFCCPEDRVPGGHTWTYDYQSNNVAINCVMSTGSNTTTSKSFPKSLPD